MQDLIGGSGWPVFFRLASAEALGLALPPNRHGQSVRVWARSLSGMQKEAVVASARSGAVWRLASDEGPYLNGFDAAPCPLAFMATGMVASYLSQIAKVAAWRDLDLPGLELILDTRYTMEGSALRGTMTGGALPPELDVRLGGTVGDADAREIVRVAVETAPLAGLLREARPSRFRLRVNGQGVPVDRVAALPDGPDTDLDELFSRVTPTADPPAELVTRLRAVEAVAGVSGGTGTSLRADQRRQLHLRVRCRLRPDGVKEIEQQLFRPLGSTFRLLSDEPRPEGKGAAPDAASYMAAGLAFCFMTQQGRYATIVKKDLSAYGVVQDLHLPFGAGAEPDGRVPPAEAVETHLNLRTSDGEGFARRSLDMAEQTCFLHALCRTPLEPVVTITRSGRPA